MGEWWSSRSHYVFRHRHYRCGRNSIGRYSSINHFPLNRVYLPNTYCSEVLFDKSPNFRLTTRTVCSRVPPWTWWHWSPPFQFRLSPVQSSWSPSTYHPPETTLTSYTLTYPTSKQCHSLYSDSTKVSSLRALLIIVSRDYDPLLHNPNVHNAIRCDATHHVFPLPGPWVTPSVT